MAKRSGGGQRLTRGADEPVGRAVANRTASRKTERVIASLVTWGLDGPLSWYVAGDNVGSSAGAGSGRRIYWEKYTVTTAQTLTDWMKFEVFWHRSSGPDGRVWMAVNGQVIVDMPGPNKISAPINRIMLSTLYSSTNPIFQWIDDVEIWDGVA